MVYNIYVTIYALHNVNMCILNTNIKGWGVVASEFFVRLGGPLIYELCLGVCNMDDTCNVSSIESQWVHGIKLQQNAKNKILE